MLDVAVEARAIKLSRRGRCAQIAVIGVYDGVLELFLQKYGSYGSFSSLLIIFSLLSIIRSIVKKTHIAHIKGQPQYPKDNDAKDVSECELYGMSIWMRSSLR